MEWIKLYFTLDACNGIKHKKTTQNFVDEGEQEKPSVPIVI